MEYNMDSFISQIIYMPFSWQINGFFVCRGQVLEIARFQALFALIGTTYGGDGIKTFALPDLRPAEIDQPDHGIKVKREWHQGELVPHICVEGIFPSRA